MIFLNIFLCLSCSFFKCKEIDSVTRRDDIVGSFKHESMIHELFRLKYLIVGYTLNQKRKIFLQFQYKQRMYVDIRMIGSKNR